MPRAQTGLEQLLAQSRQQSESTIFEEQFILHPYCESRMYLLCTFKIITKSPCFNGSGALRRPRPRSSGRKEYASHTGIRKSCAAARSADIAAMYLPR